MTEADRLVVFTLDEHRYALHLGVVERVFPSVEITPLPKAPEIVLGVVNLRGRVIPVVNIRKRFRLPEREIELSDQIIIAHTSKRPVAILADSVTGILELPQRELIAGREILPKLDYVEGVAKLADGMVLIHNVDTFLSLDEEKTLGEAMAEV